MQALEIQQADIQAIEQSIMACTSIVQGVDPWDTACCRLYFVIGRLPISPHAQYVSIYNFMSNK